MNRARAALLLLAAPACTVPNPNAGDAESSESESSTESADSTGDGDAEGESGSGSESATTQDEGEVDASTGDGDGDGDGDDEGCPAGTEGCPCDTSGAEPTCEDTLACVDGICVVPECGNGEIEGQEECDDGEANANTAACKEDCTLQFCGDGYVGPEETCDEGEENALTGACRPDCTPQECGDGHIGPDEECDDQNMDEEDGCRSNCMLTVSPDCGDGIVKPGEFCFADWVVYEAPGGEVFDLAIDHVAGTSAPDLVVLDESQGWLGVLTGPLSGSEVAFAQTEIDLSGIGAPQRFVVADLDDTDGPELLIFGEDGAGAQILWLGVTSAGSLDSVVKGSDQLADPDFSLIDVARVDSTNAGQRVLMVGGSPSTLTILTSATPSTPISFGHGAPRALGLSGGPRDHIVAPNIGTGEIALWHRSGSTFEELGTVVSVEPSSLEIGDLNADGIDDVLAISGYGCFEPQDPDDCEPTLIRAYAGSERAPYLTPIHENYLQAIPVVLKAQVGDINGDGYGDALLLGEAHGELEILEGDASGTFYFRRRLTDLPPLGAALFSAGDLNADGVADLVLRGANQGEIWVRLSNP